VGSSVGWSATVVSSGCSVFWQATKTIVSANRRARRTKSFFMGGTSFLIFLGGNHKKSATRGCPHLFYHKTVFFASISLLFVLQFENFVDLHQFKVAFLNR
jgi:hypothetical protein